MADQLSICLIGTMDHLWFHHIILLSEATTILVPKVLKPLKPSSDSPAQWTTANLSLSHPLDIQDQEKSSDSSPVTPLDDSNNEAEKEEMDLKERPTRLSNIAGRARSLSSSPLTQKPPRNFRRSGSTVTLQKSMSCRTLWDLELEEIKGFMDLGFIFKKEHLNPRMMSVLPGLQRVGLLKNKHNCTKQDTDVAEFAEDYEIEQEHYEKGIMRPYLSEAWLIKRPDSPLLNLRIPRFMAAADMKKHLRFWAKTVASELQQEC